MDDILNKFLQVFDWFFLHVHLVVLLQLPVVRELPQLVQGSPREKSLPLFWPYFFWSSLSSSSSSAVLLTVSQLSWTYIQQRHLKNIFVIEYLPCTLHWHSYQGNGFLSTEKHHYSWNILLWFIIDIILILLFLSVCGMSNP